MAARTLLVAAFLAVAAFANAEDAKIPLNGVQPIPGGLKGATPHQIAVTLARCRKAKMHGHTCLALKVYLKTCRTQHGAATLSCKPKTGHHTKGLATACISKNYILKSPRGNPACVLRHAKPHAKPHKKPHTKPHTKPHHSPTKPHARPHTSPTKPHARPTAHHPPPHHPPPSPVTGTPPPPVPVLGR